VDPGGDALNRARSLALVCRARTPRERRRPAQAVSAMGTGEMGTWAWMGFRGRTRNWACGSEWWAGVIAGLRSDLLRSARRRRGGIRGGEPDFLLRGCEVSRLQS
jgi:hypothetical protein